MYLLFNISSKTNFASRSKPNEYGAHSLRAGFITSAFSEGKSIHEVMRYSNHKDINSAQGYIRLK